VSQTEPPQHATRNTQYTIRRLLLPLSLVALGGFLRVYRIGGKGLWLDEAFSIWMGWQPVGEMLSWLVRIDQHPPLYYLLLHLWMAVLGSDDAATVRALSALFGTLTIPVVYLLGRHLADDKVGLLAALILAVSPFHVRFAQETRMYTLLTLNASLALYALARLLTDPRSATVPLGQQLMGFWQARRAPRRRPFLRAIETDLAWLGYVLFTTATLLSHNTGILFFAATNLLVLGLLLAKASGFKPGKPETSNLKPETQIGRNWLLAQLGVFSLWSPWLPAFIAQGAGVYREFWLPAPDWETVVGTVGAFLNDFLPLPPAGACAVWGLYAGLALLGLVHFRRRPARIAFLLVTLLTPFAGEWLVSLCRPIFYARTLIWASLLLYLLLAAGVRQLRYWPCVLAVVLTVLTVNALSLREYYAHFEKEQWDDAAVFVAERVKPDDLILFNATWTQIPFDYYFRRLHHCPVAEHGAPVDLFDRDVLEPKMTTGDLPRLRALIQGRERVWLVYSHNWYTDPRGLIPVALEGELDLLDWWDFYGLQVRLYGREHSRY
jgi:mannosyltransferase